MLPDLENIQAQTRQLIQTGFIPPLQQWWEDHRHLVGNYLEIVRKYEKRLRGDEPPDNQGVAFMHDTVALLSGFVRPEALLRFDDEFEEYFVRSSGYVELFPSKVSAVQPDSAFHPYTCDPFLLRLGKTLLQFWFQTTRLPVKTMNRIRKTFNRPLKPVAPMKRTVPLKNIIHNLLFHLVPEQALSFLVVPLLEQIEADISRLREIDNLARELLSGELRSGLQNKRYRDLVSLTGELRRQQKYAFEEGIDKTFQKVIPQLSLHLEKGGSIELPSRDFNISKISRRQNRVAAEFRKMATHGTVKITGLLDEWQSEAALLLLADRVNSLSGETGAFISGYLGSTVYSPVDLIKSELAEMAGRLNAETAFEKLVTCLAGLTDKNLKKLIEEIIPDAETYVSNEEPIIRIQNYLALVMEYVAQTNESVQLLPAARSDERLYTSGDLTRIRLRQLVEHDALPLIISPVSKLKERVEQVRVQLREQILETGRIAEYNLETAISLIGSDTPEAEIREIAVEGLGRALDRISETIDGLQEMSAGISSTFAESAAQFTTRLRSYLTTENMLDARSRILKARALKKGENIRLRITGWSRSMWSRLSGMAAIIWTFLVRRHALVRMKLGLDQPEPVVSPEISDFLAETQKAIARLPYVYQRLFVLSPLDDEKFFRGRKAELDRLSEAFRNWQSGRYAPAVIVGETGSGTTSLLNLFSHYHLSGFTVHRIEATLPVTEEKEFFSLISGVISGKQVTGKEELINRLNDLPSRQVIILEGIHHLFIRNIHGFKVVRMFAEVISATNHHIFWLTTSTLYGWQYLDKVMQLSDFFGYITELRALSDEEIVEVILRRHMASGYNLKFERPEGEKPGRKVARMTRAEEQQYLKNRYFNSLNQFARSNIAISMLLWLRSAKEVKGNEITIALPRGLSVSFIKTLSRDKLFLLQALLVHDGLPSEGIAGVLNFTVEKSRLLVIQLYDDGIIVRKNDLYVVNPLLYRQVVGTLRDANLIH